MITQCPSCHTHFRVHAEQLAARAGQVRCGKCNRIFDALEYLIEATTPAPALEPSSSPGQARVRPDSDATLPASESGPAGREESEPDLPESVLTPLEPVEPEATSVANAFEFGPAADANPAKRARRWPWVLGSMLMLLALFAQAGYYYRSALIVLFPEAKPYAIALCASLDCDLPLPRRIELMSIEASDLQADTTNPNIMVLSATIKNRAVFGQQLPLLELTLTDAQDLPVVRRVLVPQDYVGKAANIQAGFAANSEISIKVFIEGSQVKATGYRLYLFYS